MPAGTLEDNLADKTPGREKYIHQNSFLIRKAPKLEDSDNSLWEEIRPGVWRLKPKEEK